MTKAELAVQLNISEDTIAQHFTRTQERFRKKGIIINKTGRGEKAEYTIEKQQEVVSDDERAINIYHETKITEVGFSNKVISLPDFQFCIFVTVAATPKNFFKGTYKEFLQYMDFPATEENISLLKIALNQMDKNAQIIMYKEDITNSEYFFTGIYREVENEASIGIKMVKKSKEIADKYDQLGKKYSFIKLLKVWTATEFLNKTPPYIMKALEDITGISAKTVKRYLDVLEAENVLINTKLYEDHHCIGKISDFNIII